jgi:pimeloyl-ACP methyl ester carboxylesterase
MRAIVDQPEGSSPEQTKRSRSIRAIIRDGIALAYEETGAGTPPVLLVHGWGCDHSFLAPQAEHFSRNHRVVSVDLRGHGASDAPRQEYTVARFADDLGFLCDRLDLHEAVVVGHSMGGNIALELAARRPDLTAAVAIIDSVAFPPPALLEALRPLADALRGPGYVEALHAAVSPLFLPVDDPGRKARILTAMERRPSTSWHRRSSATSRPTTPALRRPPAGCRSRTSVQRSPWLTCPNSGQSAPTCSQGRRSGRGTSRRWRSQTR